MWRSTPIGVAGATGSVGVEELATKKKKITFDDFADYNGRIRSFKITDFLTSEVVSTYEKGGFWCAHDNA